MRRRTARMAGGNASHSQTPGRDRSRRRRAPKPLTHLVRRCLLPHFERRQCHQCVDAAHEWLEEMPHTAKRPARDRSRRRRALTLYASRAEEPLTHLVRRFVTQMRRRTARMAGGNASYSQTPGRDQSRRRRALTLYASRAEAPLTHLVRRL